MEELTDQLKHGSIHARKFRCNMPRINGTNEVPSKRLRLFALEPLRISPDAPNVIQLRRTGHQCTHPPCLPSKVSPNEVVRPERGIDVDAAVPPNGHPLLLKPIQFPPRDLTRREN
jgi:hypothetical protein